MTYPRTLLILEHPRVHRLDRLSSQITSVAAERSVEIFRCEGRPPLGSRTRFFRGLRDENALDLLPERISTLDLVLVGFEAREPLPFGWIRRLAARRVGSIRRLESGVRGVETEHNVLRPSLVASVTHRPRAHRRARVLSVFPGPMVPTTMGAHQRAFGVIEALVRDGIACDTLITCPDPSDEATARPILEQLCCRVVVHGKSGKRLPFRLRARRAVERVVRLSAGISRPAPRLFEERLHTATAFSGCIALRRLLADGQYDTVLVNFAWMEPIRALVPPALLRAHRWICDSHDVQFLRTATNNVNELRVGVSMAREKRVELNALNRFDHVLGISQPDTQTLRSHLEAPAKAIEVPSGFDYALLPPRAPDAGSLVFGFIGGGMDANVKAAAHLLTEWWPPVVKRWSAARLQVAGNVATSDQVKAAAKGVSGVEFIPRVSALQGFYRGIDCLLNPLMVHGGLNFKSVECVMAGRLLVTTPLGLQCLGDTELASAATTGADVVRALESELALTATEYEARRRDRQHRARARFGDDAAYRELRSLLRSERRSAGALPAAQKRVLVHVGDHFENWTRTASLAEQVRERGHHPIALVYTPQGYNYFMARGIDVVALQNFDEHRVVRWARGRVCMMHGALVPSFYRFYDLEDAFTDGRGGDWTEARSPAARREAIRHVRRLDKMLDAIRPDIIFVWNGYTGVTANLLRQAAAVRGLGRAFLERSFLPGQAFVDRWGVNGYSSLHAAARDAVLGHASDRSVAVVRDAIPKTSDARLHALRSCGPWRHASRFVLVPLQVQSDTNILLHSPEIKSMSELVWDVWRRFHNEETAIIVRPHPEEHADVSVPRLKGVFCDQEADLHEWIALADLVVTINSTVGLTALIHGKPVLALGRSIYSGQGLANGEPPHRADVDAYLRYMLDRHTTSNSRLPGELETLLPVCMPHEWRGLNAIVDDVIGWSALWRAFAARVVDHVRSTGHLTVVTDLRPGDTVDTTYRRTAEPADARWLQERAEEVFGIEPGFHVEVKRVSDLPDRAFSRPNTLLVASKRRTHSSGFVLDRYLAPWC